MFMAFQQPIWPRLLCGPAKNCYAAQGTNRLTTRLFNSAQDHFRIVGPGLRLIAASGRPRRTCSNPHVAAAGRPSLMKDWLS